MTKHRLIKPNIVNPEEVNSNEISIIIHAFCPKSNEPGGWASLIRYAEKKDTIYGNIYPTTTTHLYLNAILKALEHLSLLGELPYFAQIDIYTPSELFPQKLHQPTLSKNSKKSLVSKEERQLWNELVSADMEYELAWHQLREKKNSVDVKIVRELAMLEFEKAERRLKRAISKNERQAHLEGSLIYEEHQKQGPAAAYGRTIPFGGTSTGRKKRG